MAPFKFVDINKNANDLLNDDYTDKLSLKCKKAAGPINVTVETCRNPTDGTLTTKLGSKFGVCGLAVDKLQLTQDANGVLESTISPFANTTIGFNGNTQSADVYMQYKQTNMTINGILDVQNFATFQTAASLTCKNNVTLGADAIVDLNKSCLSRVNLGVNYTKGPLFGSLTTVNGVGCCSSTNACAANLGLVYQVSPKISIATNTVHACKEPIKCLTVGGIYDVPFAKFKVKANCGGTVSACMMKHVAQDVQLTVSGSVNVSDPSTFKYGLGLTI